ncbi:MAG: secondary thiamine-phosphate synthase enzyme YjbQ [Pseudomonadota bacterium]
MHDTVRVETRGAGLYEVTRAVEGLLSAGADGLLTLFVRHTSCSLLIQENADPDVRVDLLNWLGRLVPPADDPSMGYLTHTIEGPDDMPAHLKAAILPVSLQIPVVGGRMRLGTWQGIYLFEHRYAAQTREIAVHFA